MSRHKLVKTMDLDDELDDFDGGDYDYDEGAAGEEELSPEDKEQLREGTVKVRDVLGPDIAVTDKEIQDSLWHYYYDIGKTVTYLLNQTTTVQSKKSKKAAGSTGGLPVKTFNGGSNNFLESLQCLRTFLKPRNTHEYLRPIDDPGPYMPHSMASNLCTAPLTAAAFFMDAPWLDVAVHRRAEILIEPLYPRGGLLGGSSTEGGVKLSKLAALAAARKRKENENGSDSSSKTSTNSVALLDKLGSGRNVKNKGQVALSQSKDHSDAPGKSLVEPVPSPRNRTYPMRKRRSPSPPDSPKEQIPKPAEENPSPLQSPKTFAATPSIFARTMFGSSVHSADPCTDASQFTLFHLPHESEVNTTEPNAFAGPSPDDIVTSAQNSKGAKSSKGPAKSAKGDKAVNGVTDGISRVIVEDAPRARSKNLDVVAEFEKSERKNAANFVVIGHVDAGKSTLMGRLLYDLKVIDQRTIDKYRKEAEGMGKGSFALAWVLDQGTEERSRGVTIDIATNKFETEKTSFTILDAPGHRDFIPNMIAGASQADFAILVIDANTGSFESGLRGQTKEHALLVRSLGVQRIIVAVNKLDTVGWSQDRFEEIEQQISAFLTVAGFQPRNVSFVPCSGLTGDNITRRATSEDAGWYKGPVLVEQLENSEPIVRALSNPLRLTIGDIFRGGVQNPLSISGRLDAGSIQVADQVIAMPSGETAYIKGIEVDQEPSDWAVAGQNVTLHLTDIDAIHLKSGDVICTASAPITNVTKFTTKILAFEHVTPMHVDVHRGRLHAPGRITQLVATLDKGSGAVLKKRPKVVQPGSVARVVVEMEQAVPLEAPGRVVLRAGGETVAAGLLE